MYPYTSEAGKANAGWEIQGEPTRRAIKAAQQKGWGDLPAPRLALSTERLADAKASAALDAPRDGASYKACIHCRVASSSTDQALAMTVRAPAT